MALRMSLVDFQVHYHDTERDFRLVYTAGDFVNFATGRIFLLRPTWQLPPGVHQFRPGPVQYRIFHLLQICRPLP